MFSCIVVLVCPALVGALAPPPRIVFTDCDGTLLTSSHELTPRARSTLARMKKLGVRVVPATGRARAGPWTQSVLTDPSLESGQPGIYLNGCSVFNANGLLQRTVLDATVVGPVLSFAATTDGVTAAAYAGGEALVDVSDALVDDLAAVGDSPIRRVDDLAATCGTLAVSKILLLTSLDGQAQVTMRDELGPLVKGQAGLTQALPWAIEVVPLGADKATAAALLLQEWGVEPEAAMAIGDGENDVPLLKLCGLSVAMANGAAAAKAAAVHETGSNDDDGWCEAMERFVIQPIEAAAAAA